MFYLRFSIFLLTFSFTTFSQAPYECRGKANYLFQDSKILEIDILSDFNQINTAGSKETAQSAASFFLKDSAGNSHFVSGWLEARGNSRFRYCPWRPLNFRFFNNSFQDGLNASLNHRYQGQTPTYASIHKELLNILYENQNVSYGNQSYGVFANLGKKIKIVTHCGVNSRGFVNFENQREVDRAIFYEFALYKILESLKTTSLLTRLVFINYKDKEGRLLDRQFGFIREPKPAFRERCGLYKQAPAHDPDQESNFLKSYFQFRFANKFISNNDWKKGHNAFTSFTYDGKPIYTPYDFDLAWVIRPAYFKNKNLSLQEEVAKFQRFLDNIRKQDIDSSVNFSHFIFSKVNEIYRNLENIPFTETDRDYFYNWFQYRLQALKIHISKKSAQVKGY